MEVHHITVYADGENDSFDNANLLYFDYHN